MPTVCQRRSFPCVVILVALGLVYWGGSPIQPDFDKFVLFTAIFLSWQCGYSRKPG